MNTISSPLLRLMQLLGSLSAFYAFSVGSLAQPANDSFAKRTVIKADHFLWSIDCYGASLEPSEPKHDSFATRSVWWGWSAPADGIVRVSFSEFQGSGSPLIAAVYTGDALENLARVAAITTFNGGSTNIPVKSGVNYSLVGAAGPSGNFKAKLDFAFHLLPPNDRFENATVLSGLECTFSGSTIGATYQAGEPGQASQGGAVWWKWTAPADGIASMRIQGSDLPITIYQGDSLSTLHAVGSARNFEARQGEVYHIAVSGAPTDFVADLVLSTMRITAPISGTVYSHPTNVLVTLAGVPDVTLRHAFLNGSLLTLSPEGRLPERIWLTDLLVGEHTLQLFLEDEQYRTFIAPPVTVTFLPLTNTFFTNRIRLAGDEPSIQVDLRGALTQTNELDSLPSLWWSYTPSKSGWLRIVRPDNYGMGLGLYTGASLPSLLPVTLSAQNQDWAEFPIEAETNYQVRIFGSAPTNLALPFQLVLPPSNDAFSNRKLLTGDHASDDELAGKATTEPGEPAILAGGQLGTVWYTWTAPAKGTLTLNYWGGGQYMPFVGVYEGNTLATLKAIAEPYSQPLPVRAAQTLQLVFAVRKAPEALSHLELSFVRSPLNDDFASATLLSGGSGESSAIFTEGTLETGEPNATDSSARSLWYQWTAPGDGLFKYRFASDNLSPFDYQFPTVNAYVGTTLTNLQRVFTSAVDPDWGIRFTPVAFEVTNGVTYFIQALSSQVPAPELSLHYSLLTPPSNDNYAQRTPLTGVPLHWKADNAAATAEAGEEQWVGFAGCSIWWDWESPSAAWARLTCVRPRGDSCASAFTVGADGFPIRTGETLGYLGGTTAWFRTTEKQHYALLLDSALNSWLPWQLLRLTDTLGPAQMDLDLTSLEVTSPASDTVVKLPELPHILVPLPDPALDGVITNLSLEVFRENPPPSYASSQFKINNLEVPCSYQLTNLSPGYYRVEVSGINSAGIERIGHPVSIQVRPANDDFLSPALLKGRLVQLEENTYAGTHETNDPVELGGTSSLWHVWQAPADGHLVVYSGGLQCLLFTGDSPTGLQIVSPSPGTLSEYDVKRGTTYRIAVTGESSQDTAVFLQLSLTTVAIRGLPQTPVLTGDTVDIQVVSTELAADIAAIELWNGSELIGSAPGPMADFSWRPTEAGQPWLQAKVILRDGSPAATASAFLQVNPRNGFYANRVPVSGSHALLAGSLTFANANPEGPVTRAHVWYSWTAPANGRLMLTPSNSVPALHIYVGTDLAELVEISKPAGGNLVSAPVVEGEQYQIAIGSTDYAWTYQVSLDFLTPPINDNFDHSILLSGYPLDVPASLTLATTEPGEPKHSEETTPYTAWWRWTAPKDGILALRAAGAQPQVSFGVYLGESLPSLVRASKVFPPDFGYAPNPWTNPHYRVTGGQVYQIALAAPYLQDGPMNWHLDYLPPKAGDRFPGAEIAPQPETRISDSLWLASAEPGEPSFGPGTTGWVSLWHSWTPARSDWASVELQANYGTKVQVYTGGSLTSVSPIPLTTVSGEHRRFWAEAGTAYRFRVAGPPVNENFQLNVRVGFLPLHVAVSLDASSPKFTVDGLDGRGAVVEVSDDLQNWVPLINIPMGDAPATFDWPAFGQDSRKFFRITTTYP